jgi:GNAT superfamily N-acetyltransferase
LGLNLTEDNYIELDNEIIGSIEDGKCCLRDIFIEEEYRGNGYGKRAFELWFKRKKRECDVIKTTAVTSRRMEQILLDFGFERDRENRYIWK